MESRSQDGSAVYNRIKFLPGLVEDKWVMQQYQSTRDEKKPSVPPKQWDRVAIVVNRSDRSASYLQLTKGGLTLDENRVEIEYKVSCGLCHANGPRAIRPNWHGDTKGGLLARIQVVLMNLWIKSYGPLHHKEDEILENQGKKRTRLRALNLQGSYWQEPLKIPACTRCHNDIDGFGRGVLRRQHFMSIKFLIQIKQMPKGLFHNPELSRSDLKRLERFLPPI